LASIASSTISDYWHNHDQQQNTSHITNNLAKYVCHTLIVVIKLLLFLWRQSFEVWWSQSCIMDISKEMFTIHGLWPSNFSQPIWPISLKLGGQGHGQ